MKDCDNKLSREHYFSKSFLAAVGAEAELAGLPWLNGQRTKLNLNAVTANVLCKRHNTALSKLDETGTRFLETIRRFEKRYQDDSASNVNELVIIKGADLQLWILKTICGLVASGNTAINGVPRKDRIISDQFVRVLFGQLAWPQEWVLNIVIDMERPLYYYSGFAFNLFTAKNERLLGAQFVIAGLIILLEFDNLPVRQTAVKYPRPSQLIVTNQISAQIIEFAWPDSSGAHLQLDRMGTYSGDPHWILPVNERQ